MKKLALKFFGPSAAATALKMSKVSDVEIEVLPMESFHGLKQLPDLTWLDLGTDVTPKTLPKSAIRTLAALQADEAKSSMIMVSGLAEPESHERMAQEVFSTFPKPLNVEVDFQGDPDVVSTVAKLVMLRKAEDKVKEMPNRDLHAPSGRLSAKSIAELYGVTLTELCDWIGRKKQAVSKTPDAPALQDLLKPYATIALMRLELAERGDANTLFRVWLNTGHRLLEDKSPLYWIRHEKTLAIADFVTNALTGQAT